MINLVEFKQKWSFLAGQKVFVACSGGVDSMVLLHLLKELGAKIHALHVNYHLRDQDSDLDELFVKNYCQEQQIPFDCLSIDMKSYLQQNKGNLQEQARKIRYEWFEQFLTPNTYLALGHHFDDQLETFYQHLARKSGILGMACMLEQHGQVIRPLLSYRKNEIKEFALSTQLKWREDKSNTSLKYTRNRLRNEFIPFLEQKNPSLDSSVRLLIQVFQDNYKDLVLSVQPILQQIQTEHFIKLTDWNKLSTNQQLIIIKSFGFSSSQLEVINQLNISQKGKKVDSPSHLIVRETLGLSIVPLNKELTIPRLQIKKVSSMPSTYTKNEIYLDESKLKGTLQIRLWQIGDRISPVGLKGSQLISDVITDAKIPNSKRKGICVVHDEQEIHWCVGLKIGRKAMADEGSSNILKIRIKG